MAETSKDAHSDTLVEAAKDARQGRRLRAKLSTERAYTAIRAAILDGRYALGAHMVEDALAAEIGVSRTPVREALRRLAAEGMIRYGLGLGARVANWTTVELEEIMILRITLESLGAQLAARHISTDELAELGALNDAMYRLAAEQPEGFIQDIAQANHQFHKGIATASRNQRLLEIIGRLLEIPLMLQTFRVYSEAELLRSLNQHRDLISALADGDSAWASAAMSSHILSAQKSVERFAPDR